MLHLSCLFLWGCKIRYIGPDASETIRANSARRRRKSRPSRARRQPEAVAAGKVQRAPRQHTRNAACQRLTLASMNPLRGKVLPKQTCALRRASSLSVDDGFRLHRDIASWPAGPIQPSHRGCGLPARYPLSPAGKLQRAWRASWDHSSWSSALS